MHNKKAKLLFLSILMLALVGCSMFSTPVVAKRLELTNLLITDEDLPKGWSQYGSLLNPAHDSEYMVNGTYSIEVGFDSDLVPNDDFFDEQIFLSDSGFNPIGRAQNNYDYLSKSFEFGNVPLDWDFKSQVANQSNFICANYRDTSNPPASNPVCKWLARYDNTVIFVEAFLVPNRMTLSNLKTSLQKIDINAGKFILNK